MEHAIREGIARSLGVSPEEVVVLNRSVEQKPLSFASQPFSLGELSVLYRLKTDSAESLEKAKTISKTKKAKKQLTENLFQSLFSTGEGAHTVPGPVQANANNPNNLIPSPGGDGVSRHSVSGRGRSMLCPLPWGRGPHAQLLW